MGSFFYLHFLLSFYYFLPFCSSLSIFLLSPLFLLRLFPPMSAGLSLSGLRTCHSAWSSSCLQLSFWCLMLKFLSLSHVCILLFSCFLSWSFFFSVFCTNTALVVWTGSYSSRFSFFVVLLGIFFSVIGLTVSSHFLFVWLCLVLGSISTTGWLFISLPAHPLSIYFVSSVLGGLLFVFSSYSSSVPPFFSFIALLLLLGFFPFQFWSFSVLPCLPLSRACVFLGPMKTGYLFLLLQSPTYFFWLGVLRLITGLMVIFTASSIWALLWASSSTLLFQLLLLDSFLGIVFYSVYSLSLLCISYYVVSNQSLFVALVGLAGLPPLGIFWPKLLSLLSLPLLHCIALLFSSALVLYPYFQASLSSRCLRSPSVAGTFLIFVTLPYFLCFL